MIRGYVPFTLRGFGGGVIGLVATQATSLLVEAVVARRLGATGLGVFAVGMSVSTLFGATIVAGCAAAVARGVAQADHRDQRDTVRGHLLLGFGTALVTSVVAMAAVVALADAMSEAFLGDRSAATVIRIFAVTLPFSALTGVALAATRAMRRIAYDVVTRMLEAAIRLSVVPGLLVLSIGLRDVALIHLVAAALALPVALVAVFRGTPVFDPSLRPRYEPREFYSLAGWQGLGAGAWAAARRADVLVVASVLGARSAGVYRLATLIAAIGGVVLAGLQPMFGPTAARRLVAGGHDALDHFRRVTRFSLLASAPIFALCLAFPDRLLSFFGSAFEGGAVALSLLAVAYAIDAAAGPSSAFLIVAGGAHRAAANMVAALVLEVALLLALVPVAGIAGAATAVATTFLAVNAAQLIAIHHIVPGRIVDAAWGRSVAIVGGLFVLAVVARTLDAVTPAVAIGSFAAAVALFGVAVVRVALPPGDRALLSGLSSWVARSRRMQV